MILGIMQPYFFPYLGYFSLIKYSDVFIFFDTPQYISHGWINRNRIIKQDGTSTYIVVPIQKAKQEVSIKDIIISNRQEWRRKIYGQLTVYKKRAPYYNNVLDFLHVLIDKDYDGHLSNLNIQTTKEVCKYLGVEREFKVFSCMDIKIDPVKEPDEWALNITKALGGDVYVNPPGGKAFFNKSKYDKQNIELQFLQSNLPPYVQKIGHFEAGLSIIDAMMFCSPKEIADMLNDYTVT